MQIFRGKNLPDRFSTLYLLFTDRERVGCFYDAVILSPLSLRTNRARHQLGAPTVRKNKVNNSLMVFLCAELLIVDTTVDCFAVG